MRAALAGGPRTAYEIAQDVYGELFTEATATWLLSKTRSLAHAPRAARAWPFVRARAPERWSAAA